MTSYGPGAIADFRQIVAGEPQPGRGGPDGQLLYVHHNAALLRRVPRRPRKDHSQQEHAGTACRLAGGPHARIAVLSERPPYDDFEGRAKPPVRPSKSSY